MRRTVLLLLVLVTGCAHARFNFADEVVRSSNAYAGTVSELHKGDDQLDASEMRQARIARIATMRALGAYLYWQLDASEQKLADAVAGYLMDEAMKRSEKKHEPEPETRTSTVPPPVSI